MLSCFICKYLELIMKFVTQKYLAFFFVLCTLRWLPAAEATEAVWHCSRASAMTANHERDSADFSSSVMPSSNGMMAVTLDDLYAAYAGYPIRVSGKPLFACFMPGGEELSMQALDGLGASSAAMQMLSRRSAIVQRNLKLVTDEDEMLSCMEKNVPAFGYLSKPLSNDKVAPCF
jgi:hypothetical protein